MDERKPRHLDAEGLWNYALRALGGRAHSTGEKREELARRAERAQDVETVLARLKDSQYLDDRRFAEGYATARLSNERFGKTRVLQDLRHRGVAPAEVPRHSARGIVSGGQGSGIGLPSIATRWVPNGGDCPRAEEVR